jgi:hypothetical protein
VFEIVGREEELDSLHAFIGEAGGGLAALVLEGEAGIGKSTLWLAGLEGTGGRSFATDRSSRRGSATAWLIRFSAPRLASAPKDVSPLRAARLCGQRPAPSARSIA